MSETIKPYRPVTQYSREGSEIFNPYDFDPRSRKEPLIGLDGGVLLPGNIIEEEGDTELGRYIQHITMPTGDLYAVTHVEDPAKATIDGMKLHRAPVGTYLTSRALPYYEVSLSRAQPETKVARRARLFDHLNRDIVLVSQWREVMDSMDTYPPLLRQKLLAAVSQNLVNDLIAVEYARRVGGIFEGGFAEQTQELGDRIFAASTDYYKILLDNNNGLTTFNDEHTLRRLFIDAEQLVWDTTKTTPHDVDDMKSYREADATYLTLAAAQTFKNEMAQKAEQGRPAPDVLVPLLGAYDLGLALASLGYDGKIVTPIVSYQRLHGAEKIKARHPVDIRRQLPDGFNAQNYAVFEDSFATGGSMTRIIELMRQEPSAIRIMYFFPHKAEAIRKAYEERFGHIDFNIYYTYQSSLRKGPQGKKYNFPRHVTEKWGGLLQ